MSNTVDTPSEAFNLEGSEWELNNVTPQDTEVFIGFKADGKVSGNAGCNNFFGTYSQDGSRLSFGPLGATKKMCSPDVMAIETAFFNALSQTRSLTGSHLSLALRGADDAPLLTLRRRDWD